MSLPESSSIAQAQNSDTTDNDELFERVFGNPRNSGKLQQVIVPLFINGQNQDQILILLSPAGQPTVRLQATPFLQKTQSILRFDLWETLQKTVDPDGTLSLDTLRQTGIEAVFDNRRLELQIQIPPELRARNIIGNLTGLPPEARDALPPSSWSGYLNLRGGQDFLWSGSSQQLGRQPLRLSLEGVLNLNSWVVEGFANFNENEPTQLTRGDVRLVKDDVNNAIRYLVGDLAIPVTGYEQSIPMLGITVARNFSLQPYLVTRPISNFEFFLEQPSRVDVLTNGQLTQTIQLPAGPQDIRNLPLNAGINNVQLVITDPVGRVQRLDFSALVAAGLLAPGLQQFAYSIGFPSRQERGARLYDWDRPVLTLSHRFGINSTLTMGGYLQADSQQQLVGLEGTLAAPLGNVGWDLALSNANEVGADYAVRLRYDFTQIGGNNPTQSTFGLALEHRGANFTTFGLLTPRNSTGLDVVAYYNQKLPGDIYGRLNLRYQFGRNVPDAYQASLGLSKSFGNGLGMNINLSQLRNQSGLDEQRASINLIWFFPEARQSIQATANLQSTNAATTNITWNYSSLQTIEGINLSLGTQTGALNTGVNGRVAYRGYRGEAELAQTAVFPNQAGVDVRNLTQFTFGTALAFADGTFAWTRPISNSFALVVPTGTLQGRDVGVNPNSGGYVAQINALGPAVVPDLTAYQLSTLQLEAPDLPLGYDLGRTSYSLLPTYKSGTLLRVGSDATVFLRGQIFNNAGAAISLQAGEVRSLSDSNWQPIVLFTNRAGKFALTGFKPGRYEVRLYAYPGVVLTFEIPENTAGVYDVGTLKLSVD